ncbi:Hypothetical protein NTJ_14035 [Nesidiocoris tenuis]|uniref:Uncharacterized protein n=1 Tax=Nesidiocoris tenuis TaxID=355587 RepID=A0ABN7BA08_9HEMI|nr:Hypothetical protein NTJ_14035 [Nesidiocoris tenuis]
MESVDQSNLVYSKSSTSLTPSRLNVGQTLESEVQLCSPRFAKLLCSAEKEWKWLRKLKVNGNLNGKEAPKKIRSDCKVPASPLCRETHFPIRWRKLKNKVRQKCITC